MLKQLEASRGWRGVWLKTEWFLEEGVVRRCSKRSCNHVGWYYINAHVCIQSLTLLQYIPSDWNLDKIWELAENPESDSPRWAPVIKDQSLQAECLVCGFTQNENAPWLLK